MLMLQLIPNKLNLIPNIYRLSFSDIDDDFQKEPTDKVAALGASLTLECEGPRGLPEPDISWKKNFQPLSSSDRVQVYTVSN